jgi:hypothetical protein
MTIRVSVVTAANDETHSLSERLPPCPTPVCGRPHMPAPTPPPVRRGTAHVAPGPLQSRRVAGCSGGGEEIVGDTDVLRGEQCPAEAGERHLRFLGIKTQLGEHACRLDDGDLDLAHQPVVEGPAVPAFGHAREERPADEIEGRGQEKSRPIWRLRTSEGHLCPEPVPVRHDAGTEAVGTSASLGEGYVARRGPQRRGVTAEGLAAHRLTIIGRGAEVLAQLVGSEPLVGVTGEKAEQLECHPPPRARSEAGDLERAEDADVDLRLEQAVVRGRCLVIGFLTDPRQHCGRVFSVNHGVLHGCRLDRRGGLGLGGDVVGSTDCPHQRAGCPGKRRRRRHESKVRVDTERTREQRVEGGEAELGFVRASHSSAKCTGRRASANGIVNVSRLHVPGPTQEDEH